MRRKRAGWDRRAATSILVLLTLGCNAEDPEREACARACDELVQACGIETYPSLDSCLSGCETAAAEGEDVVAFDICIRDAECDLFEVIECQHAE